jgi:hypothetical protein
VKQLWERNRIERKETNRKPSIESLKRNMGNQMEDKEENEEAERKNRSTEEITVRWNQEEENGRNRKPSSLRRKGHGRKKVNWKRKVPKAKAQGNHLRNSCGSESG